MEFEVPFPALRNTLPRWMVRPSQGSINRDCSYGAPGDIRHDENAALLQQRVEGLFYRFPELLIQIPLDLGRIHLDHPGHRRRGILNPALTPRRSLRYTVHTVLRVRSANLSIPHISGQAVPDVDVGESGHAAPQDQIGRAHV